MAIQKLAYTFEGAAEQSGYSVRTLKQALTDGKLTARYVNTKGVIRHEDLAAWIDQLPTKPNTGTRAFEEDPKPRTPQQAKAPPLSMPEPESEWLTPEDLGSMLQIAVGTIGNWRTNKKGPEFVRIGGLVRYRRHIVEAWLKAQPSE
jgi:hypothetical protein